MNQLSQHCLRVLYELEEMVEKISASDFSRHSDILGASIGQHVRHTIEFFQCLEKGLPASSIDYDSRERNGRIETDKTAALQAMKEVRSFLTQNREDRPLTLTVGFDLQTDDCMAIETTYFRELAYNIEHAVHHMAILKIGLQELADDVPLPQHFGTAASTVRYRAAQE